MCSNCCPCCAIHGVRLVALRNEGLLSDISADALPPPPFSKRCTAAQRLPLSPSSPLSPNDTKTRHRTRAHEEVSAVFTPLPRHTPRRVHGAAQSHVGEVLGRGKPRWCEATCFQPAQSTICKCAKEDNSAMIYIKKTRFIKDFLLSS